MFIFLFKKEEFIFYWYENAVVIVHDNTNSTLNPLSLTSNGNKASLWGSTNGRNSLIGCGENICLGDFALFFFLDVFSDKISVMETLIGQIYLC